MASAPALVLTLSLACLAVACGGSDGGGPNPGGAEPGADAAATTTAGTQSPDATSTSVPDVVTTTTPAIATTTAPARPRAPQPSSTTVAPRPRSLLVFSRTTAFRHASIPMAVSAVHELGRDGGFRVEATEDPTAFHPANLERFGAVMFLLTTGDVLDAGQQEAFEGFIGRGGGFVGVHSAADTEYDWRFYGRLVGAYFKTHPPTVQGVVRVEDPSHPSTRVVPNPWTRTDEWYDFRTNPRGSVRVLLRVDESSYSGGGMGADHPISWCHEVGAGRSWYTALGHEGYDDPAFRAHLLGGVRWALGER